VTSPSLGRVQVIEGTPPCLPGKCVLCGTSQHSEGFIDIGFELDFYGVIYFCFDCVKEIGLAVKLVPIEEYLAKMISVEELSATITRLQNENKELRNALNSLNTVGFNFSSGDDSDSSVDSSEESGQAVQESGDSIQSTDKATERTESGSVEQTHEPRFTSVHNDESLDQFNL
jgi:hypothetical protein